MVHRIEHLHYFLYGCWLANYLRFFDHGCARENINKQIRTLANSHSCLTFFQKTAFCFWNRLKACSQFMNTTQSILCAKNKVTATMITVRKPSYRALNSCLSTNKRKVLEKINKNKKRRLYMGENNYSLAAFSTIDFQRKSKKGPQLRIILFNSN